MSCVQRQPTAAATCAFFAVGVVCTAAFSYLSSTAIGTEVAVWYSVPMCQASDASDRFLSRDLGPSEACPAHADSRDMAEFVDVHVPNKLFVSGLTYTVFLYRSDGSDIWEPLSGTYTNIVMPDGRTVSTEDSARRLQQYVDDARGAQRTSRKLLKGSGGAAGSSGYSYSGPSYRSRSGDYSYYGASAPIVRTGSRTSTSPVLPTMTIIRVHSRGPLYTSRTSSSQGIGWRTQQGCNVDDGCEYTTTQEYVKDEFTEATVVVPEDADPDGFTHFKVQTVMRYSLNATRLSDGNVVDPIAADSSGVAEQGATPTTREWPKMFVVLASDETEVAALAGGVGIFLSLLICMCFMPWLAHTGRLPCLTKRYAGYHQASAEPATPGINPVASAVVPPSGTSSMVEYPLPPSTGGTEAVRRNGDHRNLHFGNQFGNRAAITLVDLDNNDVVSLGGLESLPAVHTLKLANNDLRSLQGIEHAVGLLALSVQHNSLSSLAGLAHPRIVWLNVAGNDLKNLDGAASVPSLKYLCAAGNDITQISGLSSFPGLTHLDVSNNDVADVSGLRFCPALQGLDLSQNDLSSKDQLLALLPSLTSLVWLDMRGNDLTAVDRQAIRDWWEANRAGCTLLS